MEFRSRLHRQEKAAAPQREVRYYFCNMTNTGLSFDLAAATAHLCAIDPALARLVAEMRPFDPGIDHTQSPYEALMEAIVYQSISGKAAATIFERVKSLSGAGLAGTPSGGNDGGSGEAGSVRTLSGTELAGKA